MTEQTVIRVRGEYPTHLPVPHDKELIPPGGTIYHGPRMLSGSQVEGSGRTWGGEPTLLGCFYAAVDADDPYAAELRDENLANGAVIVEYVTDAQVRDAVIAHMHGSYTPDNAEFLLQGLQTEDDFWGWYVGDGMHYRREPVPA